MQSPWAGYQVVVCDLVLRSCTYCALHSRSKDLLNMWAGRGALQQRQNPAPRLGELGGESWELCPCHQQGHRDMGLLAAFRWVCLDFSVTTQWRGSSLTKRFPALSSTRAGHCGLWEGGVVWAGIQGITAPGRSGDAAHLECSCCEAIHIPSQGDA